MVGRPTTEVVLEAARGKVGCPKIFVGDALWRRIVAVARLPYEIEEDRAVMAVDEPANFVTRLRENEAKTAAWPANDKDVFRAVMNLLYLHNGLMITRR